MAGGVSRASKICSNPHCAKLRPCPEHAKEPWEGSTRKSRLPSSGRWAKRRRYILNRDPVCKVCADNLSTQVDHIINNDNHSPENLQGICEPCHKAKTQAEAARARG